MQELEDCAVTGTPGQADWKRRKVRQIVAKMILLELSDDVDRDVRAMVAAFDAWYDSMPEDWQTSYTPRGRDMVSFTHGWDARRERTHDGRNGDMGNPV